MKIVLNKCYGGYALSKEAYNFLGLEWDGYGFAFNSDRTNPKLVECVETLGKKANGTIFGLAVADLQIVNIPDDEEYEIYDYDGFETVEEPRTYFG